MTFPLKIVTPDGLIFDGQAEKLIVRTTTGDRAILARHIDGVFPLGMGEAAVVYDGNRRTAACMGGMLRARRTFCSTYVMSSGALLVSKLKIISPPSKCPFSS